VLQQQADRIGRRDAEADFPAVQDIGLCLAEQSVLGELLEVPVGVPGLSSKPIVPARARPMTRPFFQKYW
jgi:hypothetical protein